MDYTGPHSAWLTFIEVDGGVSIYFVIRNKIQMKQMPRRS